MSIARARVHESAIICTGFRRGAIKPRVVPFQISRDSVSTVQGSSWAQSFLHVSTNTCGSSPARKICLMHVIAQFGKDPVTPHRHKNSLRAGMLRNGCLHGVYCTRQGQICALCSCHSGSLKQQSNLTTAHRYEGRHILVQWSAQIVHSITVLHNCCKTHLYSHNFYALTPAIHARTCKHYLACCIPGDVFIAMLPSHVCLGRVQL